MNNRIYILIMVGIACAMLSCSTQKNTWGSRTFHQMKTKYNIYYNGQLSFREGEEAIREANEDDYSTLIHLYPVSNHEAAQSATSQMDRTIEKCRKCIKLHSIKARPKVDYDKRRKDPKYAAWLEQEEFNNQMGNAWLLLAKAEFHKGDFLGSVSTLNYIIRHYSHDADMVACCQLWIARAYAEMDWLYEAEDMLARVQIDNLSRKNAPLYASVSADIMLKTKQYSAAIPFLKIALPNERKHENRPRFQFVLGQLYQMQNDRSSARDAYAKVLKMHPSNEMDFNARIRQAQMQDNHKDAIKALEKMVKQDKNKDKLDLLYGAIGDVYLLRKDTILALKNYELAIEKSTENGLGKAYVLIIAADIYYQQRNYVKASPYYKEALQIISTEHEDYERIQHLSETLDALVVEYSVVELQDSLQYLSTLSDEEQRVIVDSIIARLIRAEEEEKERALQAERDAENYGGPRSVNTANMIGGGNTGNWYFYNPQLIRSGKQMFRSQWGNRTLEDNWRRLSKATTSSIFDDTEEWDEGFDTDSVSNDSSAIVQLEAPMEMDNHKPEFYLQQIPRTEEDIQQSNLLIADAMYNMVYIYRDQVGDRILSDETFEEFCRRFPNESRLLDLFYMQYLTALKENRMTDSEHYKNEIISRFPESNEAQIVSQPDYFDRLRRMAVEQDSLYEQTYKAYVQNNFSTVKANKQYAEENYPLTKLMPRFLFLNAIAVAKTDGQDAFISELRNIVQQYPENELAAMAKDMLALMGQGAESQIGATTSLQTKRQIQEIEETDLDKTIHFSTERDAPALVIIYLPHDEQKLNQLLYEIALFNFTQFLIKDFDLKQRHMFTDEFSALQVGGFKSMDEAEWYIGLIKKDVELLAKIQSLGALMISITESNNTLLGNPLTLEDYLEHISL